jgi:hypothetical protein
VGEISIPEGVEVLDDDELTIATIVAPRAVEEVAPAAETPESAEPELIRKAKEDEEEGDEEQEK